MKLYLTLQEIRMVRYNGVTTKSFTSCQLEKEVMAFSAQGEAAMHQGGLLHRECTNEWGSGGTAP